MASFEVLRLIWDQQHSFPHDYRAGATTYDWDPSKWIIYSLHRLGLATGLRRARPGDINESLVYMYNKTHGSDSSLLHKKPIGAREEDELGFVSSDQDTKDVKREIWNEEKLMEYVSNGKGLGKGGRCVVVIRGYVADVTSYLGEHVSARFIPSVH